MFVVFAPGRYHIDTEKKPHGLVERDLFFPMLCRYDEAGYLMVAGTPGSDTFTKGRLDATYIICYICYIYYVNIYIKC